MCNRLGQKPVPPETSLAVTLRMLAGGSYLDMQTSYRIRPSTIYRVFHRTCDALMSVLHLPGLPTTVNGLEEAAMAFKLSRRPPSPLTGCVGALDGIAIKIQTPKRSERPAAYFCRKGYYALPIQAMCDSSYRFLSYSSLCVGSTHDALAYAVSGLGFCLNQGLLEKLFWICGDEAYNCTESLIVPFPSSQCVEEQKPLTTSFQFYGSISSRHLVYLRQGGGF